MYGAGNYAEAARAYARLRAQGVPCATAERVQQARSAAERQAEALQEKLRRARRLQSAGFEAEARRLVQEVVKRSPQPIPTELRAVDQREGWWRELLGVVGPVLRFALEAAIAAAGIVVVILLAISGVNAVKVRLSPAARFAGFAGSEEASLSDALDASLSEVLARMKDDVPGRSVTWQSATEPPFEIPPALTESVPQGRLLTGLFQLIDMLLFRRLHVVSGTIHPVHETRGAGLTLVLATRNGRTLSQKTFWESEFLLGQATAPSNAVRYERLTLPAAVWLGYREELGFKASDPPLNTRDWRSYALFSLGELHPGGAVERQLYELALDCDPGNLGARLNLAALLMERPEYEVPPRSGGQAVADGSREGWQEQLELALEHLGAVALESDPRDEPIWYRAVYMQAVVYVYQQRGDLATLRLHQLWKEIHVYGTRERLNALVKTLSPTIAVLERTVGLIDEPLSAPAPPPGRGTWRTASAEYNLACCWARYARLAQTPAERHARTAEAVRLLRRAANREADAIDEARIDPAFDAIRATAGFQAVTAEAPPPKAAAEQPQRYALTLDPGPTLHRLLR
jgi:hypothetical protein